MTDADRDNLIARAKQLGELSHSLLTAAYTRDDAMAGRVSAQLDEIRDDIWTATFGAKAEPAKEEPKPEPTPEPESGKKRWHWSPFEGKYKHSPYEFHFNSAEYEELLRRAYEAAQSHDAYASQRRDYDGSRRRPPKPDPQPSTSEASIRRLVDILGADYQPGMATAAMVRAAQRKTHPDRPTGSAEAFKEVTTLGQKLGVIDRRGQFIA